MVCPSCVVDVSRFDLHDAAIRNRADRTSPQQYGRTRVFLLVWGVLSRAWSVDVGGVTTMSTSGFAVWGRGTQKVVVRAKCLGCVCVSACVCESVVVVGKRASFRGCFCCRQGR